MGRKLNLSIEQIKKASKEMEEYCTSYESQYSKCVSYYMLKTYAFQQRLDDWIALLGNKAYRDIIREELKSRKGKRRCRMV